MQLSASCPDMILMAKHDIWSFYSSRIPLAISNLCRFSVGPPCSASRMDVTPFLLVVYHNVVLRYVIHVV